MASTSAASDDQVHRPDSTFHCFSDPKFPRELREMIWTECLPKRLIESRTAYETPDARRRRYQLPIITQVNKEARSVTLKSTKHITVVKDMNSGFSMFFVRGLSGVDLSLREHLHLLHDHDDWIVTEAWFDQQRDTILLDWWYEASGILAIRDRPGVTPYLVFRAMTGELLGRQNISQEMLQLRAERVRRAAMRDLDSRAFTQIERVHAIGTRLAIPALLALLDADFDVNHHREAYGCTICPAFVAASFSSYTPKALFRASLLHQMDRFRVVPFRQDGQSVQNSRCCIIASFPIRATFSNAVACGLFGLCGETKSILVDLDDKTTIQRLLQVHDRTCGENSTYDAVSSARDMGTLDKLRRASSEAMLMTMQMQVLQETLEADGHGETACPFDCEWHRLHEVCSLHKSTDTTCDCEEKETKHWFVVGRRNLDGGIVTGREFPRWWFDMQHPRVRDFLNLIPAMDPVLKFTLHEVAEENSNTD